LRIESYIIRNSEIYDTKSK